MHSRILTRNLTVEDNNNHITCTQRFLDNSPWKNPEGKPVQQIWRFYYSTGKYRDLLTKIGLQKY
jgi:hypothetical protein